MRSVRGFTLVELLVVFAILALLVGLAPVAYGRLRDVAQYRDTVRGLTTDMRSARYHAMAEGRDINFVIDLQARTYGIDDLARRALPDSLQIRATVAGNEMAPQSYAAIRFLSNGGATGGSIEIRRESGAGIRLRVDWLSGRVTQEALAL